MEQTLLDLYWGKIDPGAYYTTNIPAHREKRFAISRKREVFMKKLADIDPQLRQEMENLIELQLEEDELEIPEAFCDGFRLGAKIMLDIMSDGK